MLDNLNTTIYKDDLRPPKHDTVADMVPFVAMNDAGTVLQTKAGNFVAVVQLASLSATTDPETKQALFVARDRVLKCIDTHFTAQVHTRRQQVETQEHFVYSNPTAQKIGEQWEQNFTTVFDTTHYIVIKTNPMNMLDKYAKADFDPYEQLLELINTITVQGKEFAPVIVESDALITFWATVINGYRMPKIHFAPEQFNDYLCQSDIYFPRGKNYLIFNADIPIYAGILSTKEYPSTAHEYIFAGLCQTEFEFVIHQSLQTIGKDKALAKVTNKLRIFMDKRFGGLQADETNQLAHEIEAERTTMIHHGLQVLVFGSDIDDLNKKINTARGLLARSGLTMIREKMGLEACFWSIFPDYENYRTRKFNITSHNIAHFVNFENYGGGLNACSFGDGTTARFKAYNGSSYGFTFHPTTAPMANGNTLVIGGSGSGKTTLVSFLLAQCLKYDRFKAVCFDRRQGLHIFTEFMDGAYLDFDTKIPLNPLRMGQNHITFMTEFISRLTECENNDHKVIISQALTQLNQLPPHDRTLNELSVALGQPTEGTPAKGLQPWLPDGSFGKLFNGKTDSLDFGKDIITFDTTTLLDIPQGLGALTDYIFYRLQQTLTNAPRPHAVFIDEINKYLESSIFAPKLKELLAEVRKMNGIAIMAVQSPKTFYQNTIGQEMNENIATYILFGNPSALEKGTDDTLGNYDIYKNSIGLNDTELQWIAQNHKYQVLVKRKDGDSVILNTNLAPLEQYLHIFNSSTEAVARLKNIQKQYPNDWQRQFLNSRPQGVW